LALPGQLQSTPRLDHELAFLPANLELVETPVHPAPRWTMRTIAILAIIVVIISVAGRLDIVVAAKGKLVPNVRVKLVQPAITGVVKQILVEDGQHIDAGTALMALDATQAQADANKAHSSKVAAALATARAKALLNAQKHNQLPMLEPVEDATDDDMRAAQLFAEGTFREYQDKITKSRAELSRREAELTGTLHDIDRLSATAPLARQQADDYRALVKDKYVAKADYLDKEQSALQQEHDLAAKVSHEAELRAAVAGQHADIATISSQFRREQLDGLDKASQQFTQSQDEEIKASTREHLTSLTAPVSGTVQQLAVHTVGGVVTVAQNLMEIVPDDTLEAEVNVENKDIGFVKVGQGVIVKIEAFPYNRYGFLNGTVGSVSNDAVQDKKQGLSFVARIRLPTDRIFVEGQWIKLTPGMAVSAEIKTGVRSVAAYFLDPLMQTTQESLRER
jgi:hemolysin D